jgi:hypothetical protein
MTNGVRVVPALRSATAVLINVNYSLVNVYLGRSFIEPALKIFVHIIAFLINR